MNIFIILVSVLLNSAAQIFIRKGMLQIGEMTIRSMISNIGTLLTNIWLWIAMLCYAVSVLLWMSILSKVQVSFAYPFLSVGYIISAVIGYFFFNESLSLIRIVGLAVICIGVILISRS
ncbi:SMR family transporter [Treponema maltophilum]|uniref:SMR family transporter n=1 Tax=Treponema maltophilum TaxID=51160 RepID=UPI003D8D452E